MVTIKIPQIWRLACQNEPMVQVQPGSLIQVLQALVERYPMLNQYLFTPRQELQPTLNIFINQEHTRYRGGLQAALQDGDEIYIIPMITGGS